MRRWFVKLLVVLGITFIVLGCWVDWEAPIWVWHDLAYTLIVAGGIILGYFAISYIEVKAKNES